MLRYFYDIKSCRFTPCPWHTHKDSCFRGIFQWVTCFWVFARELKKWTCLPNKKFKKPGKVHSILIHLQKQNSFWFLSNTTIYFHFILFWRHVSANWPSSGHLYKTQNKVQRGANIICNAITYYSKPINCRDMTLYCTLTYFKTTRKIISKWKYWAIYFEMCLLISVQTGPGAHLASYTMGTVCLSRV